jgi:hypothetical protein
MKIRSELLIIVLIGVILPLSVVSYQSINSSIAKAKDEMFLNANSLAEGCNNTFSEIEKYCYMLKIKAEDIKNNPVKYGLPYDKNEYYIDPQGYLTRVKPKNFREKSNV